MKITLWLNKLRIVAVLCLAIAAAPVSFGQSLLGAWSGNGNGGNSSGGDSARLGGGAAFASGKLGQAFSFDGVTGHARIPFSEALRLDEFTFAAWVSPDSGGGGGSELVFAQSTFAGLTLRRNQFGCKVVALRAEQPFEFVYVESSIDIPFDRFSHVAASWDRSHLRLYINGVLAGELLSTRSPAATAVERQADYFIGGFSDVSGYPGQFLRGKVDEVKIFGSALAAAQVALLHELEGGSIPSNQSIIFDPIPEKTLGQSPFTLSAAASSGLPVSFAVVSGPAVISGDRITLTGTGVVTVRAMQTGNNSYNPAPSVERSFTVVPRQVQVIFFDMIPSRPVSGSPLFLNAFSSSGLPITFRLISGPATVSGNRMTLLGSGEITVEALQPGNQIFAPAAPVRRSFAALLPTPANPGMIAYWPGQNNASDAAGNSDGIPSIGVSFEQGVSGEAFRFDGEDDHVRIPYSSELSFYTYTMSAWIKPEKSVSDWQNQEVIMGQSTIAGIAVQPGSGSSVKVAAWRSRSVDNYLFDYAVSAKEIPIGQMSHVACSWDGATLKIYVDGQLQGSANSTVSPPRSAPQFQWDFFIGGFSGASHYPGQYFAGLVDEAKLFNYALSGSEIAALRQNDLPDQRASQTILFPDIADRQLDESPVLLNASASSGLPIFYTVVSGPASLSGQALFLAGAGVVTVRASQPGDTNYQPAPDVERSFAVASTPGKLSQSIDFPALPNRLNGEPPFTLRATASSGLPVSFFVVSGPAEISGDLIALTGVGEIVVRAAQGGNEFFDPAPGVERSFAARLNSPPTIGPIPDQIVGGVSRDVEISVSDAEFPSGPFSFSASSSNTNLIAENGLSFEPLPAGARLSVTRQAGQFGSAVITVTVIDGAGAAATERFDISFKKPPVLAPILDQVGPVNGSIGPIRVVVQDLGDLGTNSTLLVSAANQELVPAERILFSGSGADTLVIFFPLEGKHGTSEVQFTLTDGVVSGSVSFQLVVQRPNTAPVVSPVAQQEVRAGESLSIPFRVSDGESEATNLIVRATSSRPDLLNISHVAFQGVGEDRIMVLNPPRGGGGSALIAIVASDEGGLSSSSSFFLQVKPSENLAPQVVLTKPIEGAQYFSSDLILLEASAFDPDGPVARVEFYDGEIKLGEDLEPPFVLETTLAEGERRLSAKAFDASGASASSDPAFVNVRKGPPANDAFAQRVVLRGMNIAVQGSNEGASFDPGEIAHGTPQGGKSVWWTWRFPSDARVRVSTSGSSFDTVLVVYTGASIDDLSLVAGNDDSSDGGVTSTLSFDAEGGLEYAIAVDGIGAASGAISLQLDVVQVRTPPLRIQLSGQNFVLTWPSGVEGLVVERADSLQSGVWTKIPEPETIVDGNYYLKVLPGQATDFYRMRLTPE